MTNVNIIAIEQPLLAPERDVELSFRSPNRIQTNVLARNERAMLDGLCALAPNWVTPDQLTALGVLGAVATAAGYILSNWAPPFFFLASFGLVVNWFGDSLDGSLARFRKIERPRYGFFLDHSVDAVSNLIIMAGLGFSPYIRMDVALLALTGYLFLSTYVFLSNHVSGEFRLSFLNCGPTELRLAVVALNLAMYVLGPCNLAFLGASVSLHTFSVGLLGATFLFVFLFECQKTARKLRRQDDLSKVA